MTEETHQAESEALRAGADVELPADYPGTHADQHSTHTIDDARTERRGDISPLTDTHAQNPESIVDPTAS